MKKHSKQSKVSIKRFLCVLILIFGISIFSNLRVNATTVSYDPPTYSSLIPHDPISITSDSNFTDYGFPGSGTVGNPYLIDGYNITTTSTNGISITEATKYFIICNCYINAVDYGIYIYDAADGTAIVINNTCKNNRNYGISIYSSSSSTVANNTCNNNNRGISIYFSGSSTIANNTCNNNDKGINIGASGSSTVTNNTCSYNNNWGINIDASGSSTIANNTCSNNNVDGIYIISSGSSTIANNTCNNNDMDGILLDSSGSSTVVNNTLTNCGLSIFEDTLDDYLSYSVENNWVNGKKLGFYTNLDSTTFAEPMYWQLILVNCTNVTVRNQILNGTTTGLFLYSCTYSIIINNTCSNNNKYGLWISSSDNSTVANNTCNNNNWDGIYLSRSSSATIANNTCNNNLRGIWLYYSDFCVVTYNLLQENEVYGVSLNSVSNNNLIHHNTFVDNNLVGTSQANDDGTNNYWYDTSINEGNWWNDWSGGSYYIDGFMNSADLYPLGEPVDNDPPLIIDIILSPLTPTELDTISINATVTDSSGVQSVTLHYRVNGGTWQAKDMTLVSGALYSVTIGPFAVSDVIEYYISAVDNSINYNEAINDNSGEYYSFTVAEVVPEFQTFSLLLPAITFLFLGFGLVVLQRRQR